MGDEVERGHPGNGAGLRCLCHQPRPSDGGVRADAGEQIGAAVNFEDEVIKLPT